MPKPENYKNNENESKSFFGAFMHLGNKMIMSIPPLNIKNNEIFLNENLKNYTTFKLENSFSKGMVCVPASG